MFILNFDVGGPNPTILLFVLLATGWCLGALARVEPGRAAVYPLSGAVMVAGFLASLVQIPLVAGVGAVVLVTAATPPLAGFCRALGERVVTGVAGGVLLAVGLRASLATASPYTTTGATALIGGLVVATAAVLAWLAFDDRLPDTDWAAIGTTPAPLFVLVIVAAGYLGQPWTVARWALRPYGLTVLALVAGVVAGLGVVAVRGVAEDRELLVWSGLFLGGVATVLVGSHPLTTAGLAVAWASALVLVAAGSRGRRESATADLTATGGRSTSAVTGLQFLTLLGLFLSTAATHWAFMPVPLSLMRGLGTEILFALHAVFPLSVALVVLRWRPESSPAVEQSRRSILAAVPAAVLPLGGMALASTDRGVDSPRDGSRVRVMAYNLHLFFDEDGEPSLTVLRDLIEEDGADIVAVCESDGLRPTAGNVDGLRWLGSELGYHTAFGGATRERSYGVGLLSRWPIEDVEVIELPIERSLTRFAVVAQVQTPERALPVISTHLSVGPETGSADGRSRQVETIVDRAREFDRAVVMGDFNIQPDEPVYQPLESAFTDAWTAAEQTAGTPETWTPSDPRDRIDYIFLRGEWTVHEAATKGSGRDSDHKAVVAEIEPAAGESDSQQ